MSAVPNPRVKRCPASVKTNFRSKSVCFSDLALATRPKTARLGGIAADEGAAAEAGDDGDGVLGEAEVEVVPVA